jgi:hypothetical protein
VSTPFGTVCTRSLLELDGLELDGLGLNLFDSEFWKAFKCRFRKSCTLGCTIVVVGFFLVGNIRVFF